MNSECTLSRQCFHGQRLELEAEVVQATVHCVLDNDPRQTIPEEIRVKVLEAAHKLGLSALRAGRLTPAGQTPHCAGGMARIRRGRDEHTDDSRTGISSCEDLVRYLSFPYVARRERGLGHHRAHELLAMAR